MNIEGKKISILGAERSGIAAAKLAKAKGAIPFVSDFAPLEKVEKRIAQLQEAGIEFETGEHSERVFDCEFIVTSPGVPSDVKVLQDAIEKGIPVYSELEFASWFCKGKVIAITGTNGKTTTTSLCAHTLNESGIKTYTAGNIGLAFSEVADQVKEDEFVSLEVSSFQLDHINNFKPFFALLLNITPDHLDRYEGKFENYVEAKMKIIMNQDGGDYFITNADDFEIPTEIKNDEVKRFSFSLTKQLDNGAYYKDGKLFFSIYGKEEEICQASTLQIPGEHNIANALAVIAVAKNLDVENKKILKSFKTFPGVEHRLEFVREIAGVRYINDSKATNVNSVWYALKSFVQPVYLILGGKDKGNDYNVIKDLVTEKVKKIYAIGVSAKKVYEFFKDIVPVEYKESLDDCAKAGRAEAAHGSVLLLSPACASFDMFNDYEHRGKVFKEAVNKLS